MDVPVRGTKPIKAGLLRPGTGRKITATFSEKDRHRNQTPATEPPGMGSLSQQEEAKHRPGWLPAGCSEVCQGPKNSKLKGLIGLSREWGRGE